jgi:hypothetical protein
LTRKEEKQSLQNLNNRLASRLNIQIVFFIKGLKNNNYIFLGYIDRVRQLQQENARLVHQVKTVESYQTREINNVKGMYDKQVSSSSL